MSLKNEIDKLRQIFGYLIVLISGKKESLYNRCKLHVISTVLVTRITLCCEPNHKQIKRQFSFSMLSCRDTFVVHKLLDCLFKWNPARSDDRFIYHCETNRVISPIITCSFTKQTRVSYCIGYGCVTDMSVGIRSLRAVVHLYPR